MLADSVSRLNLRWRFLLVLLPVTLGATLGMGLAARLVLHASFEREERTALHARAQGHLLPMTTRLHTLAGALDELAREVDEGRPHGVAPFGTERGIEWAHTAEHLLAQWFEARSVFVALPVEDGHEILSVDPAGARIERYATEEMPTWARSGAPPPSPGSGVRPGWVRRPVLSVSGEGAAQRIWISCPVGHDRGVVGAILDPVELEVFLRPLREDPVAGVRPEVVLLDRTGRRIGTAGSTAASAALDGFELERFVRPVGGGEKVLDVRPRGSSADWVASVHGDPLLGIHAVLLLPREALVGGLGRLDRVIVAFVGLAFVIAATAIVLLARRIAIPLERLNTTMESVARGDLTQRLPVEGVDEIAQLSRSFNTMISDLHTTHVALKSQSARLASALREVEDVEAMKDSFLALVSHEVRTPLTSIMGGVEFLREEFGDQYDETQTEFMGIVYDSARRLAGFMNDAIMMASLQASRSRSGFENFSLTALVHGKFDALVAEAGRREIVLENRMDAQREFFVHGDWTLMQVAIEKILHNAVRHNRPGGRVVVEVVERVLEDTEGDLERLMQSRGVDTPDPQMTWRAVRVFNTGPVIPDEKIEGLFARFELTHDISNHQRGSGLSLPIAGYVLNYHGGSVEVRRVGEEGMAFYLVLPGRLSVQARSATVELPSDIDDTVTAARLLEAAERDVAALEAGIEEAERSETGTDPGPEPGRELEEVFVGDHARVEVADPERSGD